MNIPISQLRREYTRGELTEDKVSKNPLEQFRIWFQEAVEAEGILEPNAMTLATVTGEGKPRARTVLLKELDERGFTFFTNYESRKGLEMEKNPWVSLVFWWAPLERQVCIEGRIEKLTPQESDEYFQTRPRGSQLGAWASRQSEVVPNRQFLENRLAEVTKQYEGKEVPRPPYWGGYRVIPYRIEFWQGREDRLHDRLEYYLDENQQWQMVRLSP